MKTKWCDLQVNAYRNLSLLKVDMLSSISRHSAMSRVTLRVYIFWRCVDPQTTHTLNILWWPWCVEVICIHTAWSKSKLKLLGCELFIFLVINLVYLLFKCKGHNQSLTFHKNYGFKYKKRGYRQYFQMSEWVSSGDPRAELLAITLVGRQRSSRRGSPPADGMPDVR